MKALCQCGCGEEAPIAIQNHPGYGWVKGQPLRFVRGHNNRGRHIKTTRYVEEDRGFTSRCWIWQLFINWDGYGSVSVDRKPYKAHRYYWEQVNGPVPDGLVLDHLCRVRSCVNPDHLEPVTHVENCRRGASSKITADDVLDIRRLIAEGTMLQRDIAKLYGVSQATICDIKMQRKWASV